PKLGKSNRSDYTFDSTLVRRTHYAPPRPERPTIAAAPVVAQNPGTTVPAQVVSALPKAAAATPARVPPPVFLTNGPEMYTVIGSDFPSLPPTSEPAPASQPVGPAWSTSTPNWPVRYLSVSYEGQYTWPGAGLQMIFYTNTPIWMPVQLPPPVVIRG